MVHTERVVLETPDRGGPVLAVVLDSPSKEFFPLGYVQAAAGVCRPLWVVLRSDEDTAHWLRLLRRSGEVVDVSTLGVHAAATAIRAFAPAGIICFGEANAPWTAQVAEALGVRYHSPRTAALLTDKLGQRVELRDHGLRTPRGWDPDMLRDDAAAIHDVEAVAEFPLVVRPRFGRSAGGRDPLRTAGQLREAVAANWPEPVLLEEFVSAAPRVATGAGNASRISVEFLVSDGVPALLSVTGQYLEAAPIRWGLFVPAEIQAEMRDDLVAAAAAAVLALGVQNGPVQVEVAVTDIGPVVVDANPWLGSTALPVLLDHALGIDVFRVAMLAAVGAHTVPDALPWPTDVVFSVCVTPSPDRRGRTPAEWIDALSGIEGIVEVLPRLGPDETSAASVIQVSGIAPDHDTRRQMEQRIHALVATPEAS